MNIEVFDTSEFRGRSICEDHRKGCHNGYHRARAIRACGRQWPHTLADAPCACGGEGRLDVRTHRAGG